MAHEQKYPEEYTNYFRDCGKLPVNEQAKVWLKAFFRDSDVDVAHVFETAKNFSSYLVKPDDTELEENMALKFLEKSGETTTPLALRKKLREYDVDRNNKLSLLEYLMMKYTRPLDAFVTNDVDCNPDLINARNACTAECDRIEAEIAANLVKIQELHATAEAGGVKKFGAQQEAHDIEHKVNPELKHQLEKARKVEAKAIKAVDEYGSDLDRKIAELGIVL